MFIKLHYPVISPDKSPQKGDSFFVNPRYLRMVEQWIPKEPCELSIEGEQCRRTCAESKSEVMELIAEAEKRQNVR